MYTYIYIHTYIYTYKVKNVVWFACYGAATMSSEVALLSDLGAIIPLPTPSPPPPCYPATPVAQEETPQVRRVHTFFFCTIMHTIYV